MRHLLIGTLLVSLTGCASFPISTTTYKNGLTNSLVKRNGPDDNLAVTLSTYCVDRAGYDEALASTRAHWDTALIVMAAVSGTTGAVTAGVGGALAENSDRRHALAQTSALSIALSAGILGLRTALNLNEQVVARREGAARRKRAASVIAANVGLMENLQAFADCIQEDVLVARTGPVNAGLAATAKTVGDIEAQMAILKEKIERAAAEAEAKKVEAERLKGSASSEEQKETPVDKAQALELRKSILEKSMLAHAAIIEAADKEVQAAELEVKLAAKEEESIVQIKTLSSQVGAKPDEASEKKKKDAAELNTLGKKVELTEKKLKLAQAKKDREDHRIELIDKVLAAIDAWFNEPNHDKKLEAANTALKERMNKDKEKAKKDAGEIQTTMDKLNGDKKVAKDAYNKLKTAQESAPAATSSTTPNPTSAPAANPLSGNGEPRARPYLGPARDGERLF